MPQLLLKHRNHEQQSRVVEQEEFKHDLRTYRQRCFQDLFSQATEQEWLRHARIAEKQAFDSRAELERAGAWLAQLAQVPDPFLGQIMAMRWRTVCRVSAQLGPDCYRIYQQYLPQMTREFQTPDRALWLLCALRLIPNSHVEKIAVRAVHVLQRKHTQT